MADELSITPEEALASSETRSDEDTTRRVNIQQRLADATRRENLTARLGQVDESGGMVGSAQRQIERLRTPSAELGTSLLSAQGTLFGFADETKAAIRALWDRGPDEDYGDAYLRIRDTTRKEIEAFREARPALATSAEIGGGFAVPGVGVAKLVVGGVTTGARVLRGAVGGAVAGGIFGAGEAEELGDIPAGVAGGAALGTTIGAAIPGAVAGGQRVVQAVRSTVSPQAGATQRIGQAIGRDEMTPQQIAGALDEAQRLGRPATVADVGGEAVRRELEVAVQTPGAAAQIAERVLDPRNKNQLARISRDLVRGTGVKSDVVEDAIEKTMHIRSNAAAPVYKRAMDFPAELSEDIVDVWNKATKTPLGKAAMGKARKILNVEKFDEAPLMERIDAFKRGLDDLIGGAKRKGENAIARRALEVKNDLVELVDAVNPNYKKARQIWENGSNYLEAIDRGRDVLKPAFTAARFKREFAELTDVEQEAFRLGVVDAITTRLRQQSAQEPNLIKLLRSPEMRDKLKVIMKPKRAAELDRILDIEDAMFRTASQARRGSQTAQRQAAIAEQEKNIGITQLLDEVTGLVITPLRNLFVRRIPSATRAARDRLLARQNALITRRLLSSDPDELLRMPQAALRSPRVTGGRAIVPGIIAGQEE